MGNSEAPLFVGLKVKPVTKSLVLRLLLDLPLRPSLLVDFGVDSANHYRALTAILANGPMPDEGVGELVAASDSLEPLRQRILELDDALGNGPKLNALVRRYAPEYAQLAHFHTTWDELCGRTADTPEETQTA